MSASPSKRTPPKRHLPSRRIAWLSALWCALFAPCFAAAEPGPGPEANSNSDPSDRLIDLVFEYRAQNGLPAIPVSPSMTTVAAQHVADLERHPPAGQCSAHSWSTNPRWSACCYTRDHAQAHCMWDKPREITHGAYTGQGFEIVCTSEDRMTAETAMDCWRHSALHHAVLLNRDAWRDITWQALGIRLSQHYAVLWLGTVPDR